ncbi:MAG: hypothetical protein V1867_07480 [Candidatus Falkowbacteria bacterium]
MNDYKNDLEFIKKYFHSNKKLNFTYSWNHAVRTAEYLNGLILKHGETGKNRALFYGALGHDLLEDTEIDEGEIARKWGKTTLLYIRALTNRRGDDDFDEYIEGLKKAEEEILLIKLADIRDNADNSLKKFADLKPDWLKNFWLPLLKKYEKELFGRKFRKYPLSSAEMIMEIKDKIKQLESKIKPKK